MTQHMQRVLSYLFLLLALAGCGYDNGISEDASPNTALFDPGAGTVPLPNVLATATAKDPITQYTDPATGQVGLRPANTPMNPLEALTYVNLYEVGGSGAVSGVNAPIYIRFARALAPASVNADNIKVFQIGADSAAPTATENEPLRFTDVTRNFSFSYTPGRSDVSLFPNFPLLPATRYLYLVTNRVRDAATGGSVGSSVYFAALKSTLPLGGAFEPLEAIRADTVDGTGNILFSGYGKVLDDLTAPSAGTTVTSRDQVALIGRFNTTAAQFIATDPVGNPVASQIPVESALRAFAAGSELPGGLSGKSWIGAGKNAVTVTTPPGLTPAAYWAGVLAGTGLTTAPPATVGAVATGTFTSADISMNPVAARGNPSMNLNIPFGTYSAASAVLLPFRDPATRRLTGFYHTEREIPFVYIAPAGSPPAGGWPLAIYQPGINRTKEDVVALAGALTGAGFAVVAMDLPLHGELALPGHATRTEWGQDFIALGAPLATRTNVQQAALNLHRLELVLATPSFNPAFASQGFATLGANAPNPAIKPRFIGMSLGAIVGSYYLAGNTTLSQTTGIPPYSQATLDQDMKGVLNVPAGRTAYALRDSPDFGPSIAAGLAASGVQPNTPLYHQFFLLTQSVVDPVDPATMTTPLPDLQGTGPLPSRLSGRVLMQEATSTSFDANGTPVNGDIVIPNSNSRYLGNALGGRGVLGTPEALATAPGFSQLSYLSGRVPAPFMMTLSGGSLVPKIAPAAGDATAAAPGEGYFQFDQADAKHGSLIDLVSSPESLVLMQRQMVHFILSGVVVDPTVVTARLPKGVVALGAPIDYRVTPPKAMKVFGSPR